MTDRITGINVLAINGRPPKEIVKGNHHRLQKLDSILCRPSYHHAGCITLTIAGRQFTIQADDAVKKIESAKLAQLSLFPEGLPDHCTTEKKTKKQKQAQQEELL